MSQQFPNEASSSQFFNGEKSFLLNDSLGANFNSYPNITLVGDDSQTLNYPDNKEVCCLFLFLFYK